MLRKVEKSTKPFQTHIARGCGNEHKEGSGAQNHENDDKNENEKGANCNTETIKQAFDGEKLANDEIKKKAVTNRVDASQPSSRLKQERNTWRRGSMSCPNQTKK